MFVSFGTVAIFQRIAQSIHDSLQLCGVEAQQVHVFVFGPDANTHTGCDVDVHVRTLATIQFTQIRAYFRFTRHPPARTPGQLLTGNLDLPAELRSSSFDRTQLNIRLDTLTNG